MKDVISVDTVLENVMDDATLWYIGRITEKEYWQTHNEAKHNLHSLLISKLPEKMVRSEVFEGESDGTIEAYNSAIDDMHRVIDEMFEVHNEK